MKDILHIYTRVSTAVQEQGTSLNHQKELGQKCAAENELGFEVHNEGVHSSSSVFVVRIFGTTRYLNAASV